MPNAEALLATLPKGRPTQHAATWHAYIDRVLAALGSSPVDKGWAELWTLAATYALDVRMSPVFLTGLLLSLRSAHLDDLDALEPALRVIVDLAAVPLMRDLRALDEARAALDRATGDAARVSSDLFMLTAAHHRILLEASDGASENPSAELQALARVATKALGAHHPRTMEIVHDAGWLGAHLPGGAEVVRDMAALQDPMEEIFGADSREVITLMLSLGGAMSRLGDAAAESTLVEAVRRAQWHDPNSALTWFAHAQLAFLRLEQGEDVVADLERILRARRRAHICGESHPRTRATAQALVRAFSEAGRVWEALDTQQELVTWHAGASLDSAQLQLDIAALLVDAGYLEQASQHLTLIANTFEPDPSLQREIHALQVDVADALSTSQRISEQRRERGAPFIGPDGISDPTETALLQRLYALLREPRGSHLRWLVQDASETLGPTAPITMEARFELACWELRSGRGSVGERELHDLHRVGASWPTPSRIASTLGNALLQRGTPATWWVDRAVATAATPEDLRLAYTLLGAARRDTDPEGAVEAYQIAMQTQPPPEELGLLWSDLGGVYMDANEWRLADDAFIAAEELLGDDSSHLACLQAITAHHTGDFARSARIMRTLQVYIEEEPPGSVRLADCIVQLTLAQMRTREFHLFAARDLRVMERSLQQAMSIYREHAVPNRHDGLNTAGILQREVAQALQIATRDWSVVTATAAAIVGIFLCVLW